MSTLDGIIDTFVAGENLNIERTVTGVPTGQTLTGATFTVKVIEAGTYILQKTITDTLSASGAITDTGADGTAVIVFTLSHTDTDVIPPEVNCYYWIEVVTNLGHRYIPEKGRIKCEVGV